MSRRFLLSATLAILLTGAGGGLLPTASAAVCPAWADVAGDAAPDSRRATADPSLDITSVRLDGTADLLRVVLTVADLADRPLYGAGDEYALNFRLNGKDLQLYADRLPGVGEDDDVYDSQVAGIYGGEDIHPAEAVYDSTRNTVTITAKMSDLATASGGPALGATVSAMSAEADVNAVAAYLPWDRAVAPAALRYTLGSACTAANPVTPAPPAPSGRSPRPDCATYGDSRGDAAFLPVAGQAVYPNDPDLDLTGLVLETTPTTISAWLRVDRLDTRPARGDGHQFEVSFTHNSKVITLYTLQAGSNASAYREANRAVVDNSAGMLAFPTDTGGQVGGSYAPELEVGAVYDRGSSVVVISVDRASIEDATGAALPAGAALTSVRAASRLLTPATAHSVDSVTPPTGDPGYTVGDNRCFPLPPAVLSSLAGTRVQYGDRAHLSAILRSGGGAPLPGRDVRFAVGGASATGRTDSAGVARASLWTGRIAGSYALAVSFAGDAVAGPATLSGLLTVVPEATRISFAVTKKGSSRTVVARLAEDDGPHLAGRLLTWYVDGRRVATTRTDAAGRASYPGVKAGRLVVVEFAGQPGYHAAARGQIRA